uniref:GNamide n=1 Tax=Mizuhopecten yessoensis TaxID=6573 RepID=A0A346GAW9_MIZYE|nr:GNamide [Mizuhopecten yessoensis]
MNSLPYVTVSMLLLLSHCDLGHAQWAQTFGWGGAGNGKRSGITDPTTCNMDLQLVKLMSTLIQHELKRLKTCSEQKIPQDLLDI